MGRTALITIVMSLLFGASAWANCWNSPSLEEDPPSIQERFFTTCLGSSCIEDKLLWECANSSWMGAEFEGGFRVSCGSATAGAGYGSTSAPSRCYYYLGGYEIGGDVLDSLTCAPKEEGDTGCSWFPVQPRN